ncbi:MAG: type II toxin-antitoxin system mRNA interferase toxin, RelE/StbE family [Candidatus Paceibacterota bacterium]|jgi:mRNA-degrading endonuclease YafQ of YafQ-DinJ toxin-antitoxin module
MLKIIFAEKFISQFELLDRKTQRLAERKIDIFKVDYKHPSLKTHKLNGVLDGYFSFSVNYQIRIVFEYGQKDTVYFLKIGNHAIYR